MDYNAFLPRSVKMKKSYILLLLCVLSCQLSFAQIKAVPVILDSDMGPDYDDTGAITILHALADSGYAEILATVASTKYEGVAGVLNVFNTYFNRPQIPVGVPKGNASALKDNQHWTDTLLVKYPHAIKRNADVPDAVEIYRKILSARPDHTVTIVTIGFLTNLANLLDTKADKYSPLSGRELIRLKVKHLVSMAGGFPSGKEFNIFIDSTASKKVFKEWPTHILFDGFEIGEKIKTGLPLIANERIKNSPVKDVFRICIPLSQEDIKGRMSWDEIAVLIAVKGYEPWFTVKEGRIVVADDGSNKWDNYSKGHSYILFSKTVPEIEEVLNRLMMQQPK
jgi:inosine-uridine nucleoside N-ribohydrolase